jgi:uncharacterized cupin superfamily protein
VPEAPLEQAEEGGLVPKGEGWFVVNARDARWMHTDAMGSAVMFEGDPKFGELGINIGVMQPGQPACMYHGENAQEDFLILAGEALLVIEGEERPLKQWDFVHCPPWAAHVIVATGDAPCVVLSVGARPEGFGREGEIVYPTNERAAAHGASVETETKIPREAYAAYERPSFGRYRDGDLPG